MRTVCMRFRDFVCFALLVMAVAPTASAVVIDFETFAGPSTFAAAGNAQTLNIPTTIGIVKFQGGVILTNTTNLPADETSIYGTAGNAANIGVTPGSGFTNPLTITFPVPIQNFFLDVLNGNVQNVTYQLADNLGNSASFTLAPNLSSGQKQIGFAAAGTVVTVMATTGQTTPNGITWDFFIDNVHFDEPLPTSPEPSALIIVAVALPPVLGYCRHQRRAK
jgi:hypothetical protein